MQKIEAFGEVPLARFGHTVTLVSKKKAVLFGGATGDTGKYVITGDTYIFEIPTKKWTKLEGGGITPAPRAAHSSTSVDTLQMVVYGGATGGGSLASDDLYLLDLRNGEKKAQWMIVPVVGKTPGRRYGHTIIFSKPFLLVFGGNTGTEPVNDVWCLNVDKAPFSWLLLETAGEQPCVRVYHSAALCSTGSATGMMVVFGGRTNDQTALKDSWGLRRHRDGRWDWVKAPYKPGTDEPLSRYQHSTAFIGPLMLVIGGRTDTVGETVSLEVYDTESSEWKKFSSIQRFRHACFWVDTQLYMHGGFDNESPTVPTDAIMKLDAITVLKQSPILLEKIEGLFGAASPGTSPGPTTPNSAMGNSGKSTPNEKEGGIILKKPQIENMDDFEEEKSAKGAKVPKTGNNVEALYTLFLNYLLKPKEWASNEDGIADTEMDRFHFRTNYIIALVDECQKAIEEQPMVLRVEAPVKVFGDIHGQYQDLMRFFDLWGEPSEKGDIESYDYLFLGDYVDRGSHSLETIWLLMALKIKFPNKIHLLRGNHEDKWINNAFGFAEECSTRLVEDPGEPESVFNRVNELFDWLPLAAIIEEKIVCLHGGIGSTLASLEQIEAIQRPLEVIHEVSTPEQQLVVDILWSDPTDNDQELGIQPNFIRDPNGTGNIVKFGPDRVKQFLENNGMSIILRAHECVMDGFERFAGGQLITVFSATDYCGRHKNAGAVLDITKHSEIIPKLIYPLNNAEHNWEERALEKRPPTPPRWSSGNRKESHD